MRIAEQVSVERPADDVLALLAQRPSRWMASFLRLAWHDARGRGTPGVVHRVVLGGAVEASGHTTVPVEWTTAPGAHPFERLRGHLVVTPTRDGCVLGIVATQEPEPPTAEGGESTRPAERVARSLLGHLRAALERDR